MKKMTLLNIGKWLCLLLCACFLLTACSKSEPQGTLITPSGMNGEEAESIDDIARSHHSCFDGAIMKAMYKNIGDMTIDVYKTLTSENLLSIVILAFTVWMAFQILKHISSTTPESIGEFWTKVLRKAAICTACGILASSPDNILYAVNTFIFPIYTTILEFTSLIMKHLGSMPEAQTAAIKLWPFGDSDNAICEAFVHKIGSCKLDTSSKIEMTTSGFPQGPVDLMSCMACMVNDRLSMGTDIGLRLIWSTNLTSIITGIFVIAIFVIAKWSFALYLIDGIFRLNMMIIIMPFLIMFYPFEQTRRWSFKGFQIILSSAAIMMSIGLIVTMTTFAMEKLLIDKSMRIAYGSINAYTNFGVIAMSILFMAFIIKQACSMGVELAGHITGYSGDTNFGKNAKSIIQTAGAIIWGFFTFGCGLVFVKATTYIKRVRQIQETYEKAKNKAQEVAYRVNHAAGRDRE